MSFPVAMVWYSMVAHVGVYKEGTISGSEVLAVVLLRIWVLEDVTLCLSKGKWFLTFESNVLRSSSQDYQAKKKSSILLGLTHS
jgi:hypothetical protein